MTPLETCLGVSGQFEGGDGGPRYDLLTGNFDGMGISIGCLQWNPGTGSAQELLQHIFAKMDSDSRIKFSSIARLKDMDIPSGTAYAVQQWVGPDKKVLPAFKQMWSTFLLTPESRAAQQELAQVKLDKASHEAQDFMPFLTDLDVRTLAFFFDVRVQQGGLTKTINGQLWMPTVLKTPADADWRRAVDMAYEQGKKDTAKAWEAVCPQEPLAAALLHYAFERASKARPEFIWDSLSRRGTIACRRGGVHGVWFDLTKLLP